MVVKFKNNFIIFPYEIKFNRLYFLKKVNFMKYVSIDIETTGVNPLVNDIIEFAAVIDDTNAKVPIENLPKFHRYIKKEGTYNFDAQAVVMHKRIFEKILQNGDDCIYIDDLMYAFGNFLQDNDISPNRYGKIALNVAGKNFGSFDYQFLKEKIKQENWNNIIFRSRFIDPAILYFENEDYALPDLETCVKRYQRQSGQKYNWDNHTALDDAMEVIKLVRYKII